MPRPKTPAALIPFSPGMKKNPKRKLGRINEPIPQGEVGEPQADLPDDVADCFREIVAECAPGVLKRSDRAAVRSAARLMAKENTGTATAAEVGQLKQYFQQFGMTPAGRANVQVKQEENGNEFAAV